MLELMICSLVTILPDYLYRRYRAGQAVRQGDHLLLESGTNCRWGITGCLMLTISLITMIFYFHPSTTSAAIYFRTVPILPEGSGRVAEVNVGYSAGGEEGRRAVQAGQFEADRPHWKRPSARSPRSMPSLISARIRHRQGRGPDRGSQSLLQQAKDELDVKTRAAAPQSRHRAAARHREAAGGGRSAAGRRRCRHRGQGIGDRCGFPRCCRPRRQVPRPRWRRRKSISTRPSFAPASTGGSNNSSFAPATSSPRSCGRPAC